MRTMKLGQTDLQVPVVAVGCMHLHTLNKAEAGHFLNSAIEMGANFFDHADIYAGGRCESLFAEALPLTADRREKILIQSKCGIVRGKMFDFSKEHILKSVEQSLQRLQTEYLDVLLLHRPDALMEPDEVAEAFDLLESSGRVRHFGVSNQNPWQIQLLKKSVRQPIAANQLQLSLLHTSMIDAGLNVNRKSDPSIDRDGGILDFCRLQDITIQAWSPFQRDLFSGTYLDNPDYPELNAKLVELADRYGVTPTTIVIAWFQRHPAGIQPVTGTTKVHRLADAVKAAEIRLTRQEWYALYLAAGNKLP
jgi:predicted oxidoreductase